LNATKPTSLYRRLQAFRLKKQLIDKDRELPQQPLPATISAVCTKRLCGVSGKMWDAARLKERIEFVDDG